MKFVQKIKAIFMTGNTIIQQSYENERLIDQYLKKEFEEIDKLFEDQEYQKIEEKMNTIYIKKQDRLNEELERGLLKYKCLLALIKKDDELLDTYVSELSIYGENTEELRLVKFNIAILKKDNNLFNKLKADWKNENLSIETIDNNEIQFLYLTKQYDTLVNKFNRKQYLDKDEFKIYLSKALIETREFDKAKELLDDIKNNSDETKFLYILSLAIPILIVPRYLGESTDEEKIIFNECLKIMEEIDFNRLSKPKLSTYIYYKFEILLFYDKKRALDKINNIPALLCDDTDILWLKMNIYSANSEYEIADQIGNSLMEKIIKKEEITKYIESIITVKSTLKKWDDIIDIYNEYKKYVCNNQFAFYIYGMAIIKLYGETHLLKIIERECKTQGILVSLLFAEANINDKNKCMFYLDKATSSIDKNNLTLLDIVDVYERIGEYNKALEILEKSYEYDIRFFKKYIHLIIKNDIGDRYRKILDVYKDFYIDKNNDYIDNNIYAMCLKNENYRYAYQISKKCFKSKANSYWRNEYLRMKLKNKDFTTLKQLAEDLSNEDSPEFLITAAEAFLKLGEKNKAEELAYKVAYKLENIDIFYAIRINNLLFKSSRIEENNLNKNEEKREVVELNDVIILHDDSGKELKICLNTESCYRGNTQRFGCMHIDQKSDLWIDLLGSRINDVLKYESRTYTIVEIINKIDYLNRICFHKRLNENRENIQNIIIDDDLIDLKKNLQKIQDGYQRNIDLYINNNLSNEFKIPTPINIISDKILKLEDVINLLLYDKDLIFKAGIPTVAEKNSEIVLTVLSVIFLNKYNLLNDFMEYYNVYIPNNMIAMFEDLINNLFINFYEQESYLNYIDDNIILNTIDENSKKIRIKKYKEILKVLKKGTIVSMDFSESMLLDLPEQMLFISDIESLEIAKNKNIMVCAEDAFLHTLSNGFFGIPITNSATFINNIMFNDFNRIWEISEELIVGKYKYFFNYSNLALFVINYKIESNKDLKRFKKIINLILKNDLNEKYKEILEYTCKRIFYLKIYNFFKVKVDLIMNQINKIC